MAEEYIHRPVMTEEVVEMLQPKRAGVYVDATLGMGGHSERLLMEIGPEGRIIGIDRDDDALRIAGGRLSDKRAVLKKGIFSEMENILSAQGISKIDGVVFDLGVSMLQLKDPARGFSFLSDRPLDMRMDTSRVISAWHIVNRRSEKEIEKILREFGEEWQSKKIARAIVGQRAKKPIDTCAELADLVSRVYGRRGKTHPATKTFQALRIAVNDEIGELNEGLSAALRILREGGRMCVISYHSLEDRVVKYFIASGKKQGTLRSLVKKPLTPSPEEVRHNPSARSAKLRAAEKI